MNKYKMTFQKYYAEQCVKHYINLVLTKILMKNLQLKYPKKKFTFTILNE